MVAEDTEELYDDLYEDFGGGKQFLKTSLQEVQSLLFCLMSTTEVLSGSVSTAQVTPNTCSPSVSLLLQVQIF